MSHSIKSISEPGDVAELDELKEFVTYRLSQLQSKLNTQGTHVLRKHCGLSLVQWRIIAILKLSAPTNSAALVRSVGMDAGLLSRNLKTLIRDGLVCAQTNPDDQRQQIVSLTTKGEQLYRDTFPVVRRRQQLLLENISRRDLTIFYQVLDQLDQNSGRTLND